MKKDIILVLVLMLSFLACPVISAQNSKKGGKAAKKTAIMTLEFDIVDKDGNAIPNAELLSSQGTLSWYADSNGKLTATLRAQEIVVVKAEGYSDVIFAISKNNLPDEIVMFRADLNENQRSVGATASIAGEVLEGYSDLVLSNSLQGRLPGLTVINGASGLGNNLPSLYIRGNHRNGANTAIVIVDGLERAIEDILPEEVETIEILKDATAKILYGSRAANGVMRITTKKGNANTRIMRASVESGVKLATRMPEYLDSYDYATLYNEARLNDGMPALYSEQQLLGYKNSTGANDLLYPNVNYHDYFLRNHSMYNKVTFDMKGGSDKLKYSLVANYIGGDGFEKIGQCPTLNRISIRGNVEAAVTDYLSIVARAAARLETKKWGSMNQAELYGRLSSTRPNEYPLMISPDVLGLPANEDGTPFFGTNIKDTRNVLAGAAYGGFNEERYISSMVDVGLALDLDQYVKGLKASAFLMFDNYMYYSQGQTRQYPTYAIRGTNYEDLEFTQMRKQSLESSLSYRGNNLRQALGFNGDISWNNTFGKHDVGAAFSYKYYNLETTGLGQDVINDNTALKLNYGYDQRYFVEATAALMGSNRYAKNNRMFLSYAIGAAWVISNENFMVNADGVDFLKLKASYGLLGFDRETDFLYYQTSWTDGGSFSWGEQNKGTLGRVTNFVRIGENLKWEKAAEVNVGVEAEFLNHRLKTEINYFNELRSDIICGSGASFANVLGNFTTLENGGKVRNQGVDAYISWGERKGNFAYQLGANMTWSKSIILEWNHIPYPDKDIVSIGKPADAIYGFESLGIYGKDVQLGSVKQMFGYYKEGYLAYKDNNNDNVVDSRDQKVIGNSFPRAEVGVDVDLKYKGWRLYAHGTAHLGVSLMRNTALYHMAGESKYSILAKDRWHPVNNPDGIYPALTTMEGSNNFVASTFWIENGSFFRLKDVEFSYTFTFPRSWCKHLKIFARGNNLFVLSAEKLMDPETKTAGIGNYPMYRTVTGGLAITF